MAPVAEGTGDAETSARDGAEAMDVSGGVGVKQEFGEEAAGKPKQEPDRRG